MTLDSVAERCILRPNSGAHAEYAYFVQISARFSGSKRVPCMAIRTFVPDANATPVAAATEAYLARL